MLIPISESCSVAADCVAEVKIAEDYSCVIVKMKDGVVHKYQPKYPERRIEMLFNRLVTAINAALEKV